MTILKHPDYILQTIPDGLDHIRCFENSFKWVNPPKYDKETVDWGVEIKEVAIVKINELLLRYDLVEEHYKHNIALIHKLFDKLPDDDFTLEFYLSFEAQRASEVVFLKKWLKYWSRVYDSVSVERILPTEEFESKGVTEELIERAKNIPIEELYDGDLKIIYGKAVGLCPFHKENTPSFTIFINENKYHCFGCQKHGDSIDFYMHKTSCDFITAVKGLLNE